VTVLDLGGGVEIEWTSWADHEKVGFIETHDRPDGSGRCSGGVLFDLPGVRDAFPGRPVWTVESWEPLTLSPSLLCRICSNHGWIRQGRWVPA
jgi:hypothetical protein